MNIFKKISVITFSFGCLFASSYAMMPGCFFKITTFVNDIENQANRLEDQLKITLNNKDLKSFNDLNKRLGDLYQEIHNQALEILNGIQLLEDYRTIVQCGQQSETVKLYYEVHLNNIMGRLEAVNVKNKELFKKTTEPIGLKHYEELSIINDDSVSGFDEQRFDETPYPDLIEVTPAMVTPYDKFM